MALLLRFRRRRANSGCNGRSFVDLVEADLLGIGCGRKQCDRTGNDGKAQEPLPIGAGCHEKLLTKQKLRIQNWSRWNRSNFQNERWPFASQSRALFSFSSF